MKEHIWTFDNMTENSEHNNPRFDNGLYYYGDKTGIIQELSTPYEGIFSDGTSINTTSTLNIGKSDIEDAFYSDTKRIAGMAYDIKCNVLAFNAFTTGKCVVMAKSYSDVHEKASLTISYQYRDLGARYNTDVVSKILGDDIDEISMEIRQPGSCWISVDDSVSIYAVRFVPYEIPKITKNTEKADVIIQNSNGNIFTDFGKDAFAQLSLRLTSNEGNDTVTVHLGECSTNYCVDKEPSGTRRCQSLRIPLKKGTHTYTPDLSWQQYGNGLKALYMPVEIGEVMPFRYCEIEGYNNMMTENDIERYCVNYEFNDGNSEFECDNQNLNQVWELCKHTIKATSFLGYYVDGDRERCPYEADALINQLSHFACDNEYSISRRSMEYLLLNPTWPTEWILQTVPMAWNDYIFSGNDYIITKYTDLLNAHTLMSFVADNGLVSTTVVPQTEERLIGINKIGTLSDIVDWPHSDEDPTFAPLGGEDDSFVYSDYNSVVNAWHYEACINMSYIFGALNRDEEAKVLSDYCMRFKNLFNNFFLDTSCGLYRDGVGINHYSLHSNMFALCFGLVPDEYVQTVVDYIESKGMACSVYGAQFLLEALYKSGNPELALELMSSDGLRSWINMINEGSTMTTEAWSNLVKPNQDWNHAWGAAPANIIQFYLVGIRPSFSGVEDILITPQIGSLKYVKSTTPTRHGIIDIKISNEKSIYNLDIECPESLVFRLRAPLLHNGQFDVYLDDQPFKDYIVNNEQVEFRPMSGSCKIELKYKDTWANLIESDIPDYSAYDIFGRKVKHMTSGIYVKGNKKIYIKP